MTTSRRSFFKCLVGAFVASAIELNLAIEPVMPRAEQIEAMMRILTEEVEKVWKKRYREEWARLASEQTLKGT